MTATVMIEVACDAAGCEHVVRAWHWVSRPLQSMAGAKLRRQGWLTVKAPEGKHEHYCPEHAGHPVARWDRHAYRGDRFLQWEKVLTAQAR
jgi:hypothetical protein